MRKYKTEIILITLVATLMIIAAYGSYKNSVAWNEFKIEHDCEITEKVDSTTSTGISSTGQVVSFTSSGYTKWLCDDGVTYTR